jgi:hypothetical protein
MQVQNAFFYHLRIYGAKKALFLANSPIHKHLNLTILNHTLSREQWDDRAIAYKRVNCISHDHH